MSKTVISWVIRYVCAALLSTVVVTFHIFTSDNKRSSFSAFSPAFKIVIILNFNYSNRYIEIFHCSLNLHSLKFKASLVVQIAKNLPAMQETQVWSLGQEIPLEKGIATHSSGQRPVILSIFSCVYLSSIYHLWCRLQAKICPFLKMGHLPFNN